MPGDKIKSKPIAYLLWFLSICGWFGLHRFYLGKKASGIVWVLTGGCIGIGALYDLFSLGEQINQYNRVIILKRLAGGLESPDAKAFDSLIDTQINNTGYYCPYCLMGLKHIASRKMKCPFCQNEIKIRFNQTLFPSALLTKEDAAIADHFKILKRFKVTENDFSTLRNNLSTKYGEKIFSTDIFWLLFKQKISELKDLELLKSALHSFASFLTDAEIDYITVLQRSAKIRLLELRSNDFDKVRIVSFGISDSCPACKKLEGKVLTINEALRQMPLPVKTCSYKLNGKLSGFCRCAYEGVEE